jgi:hypothetical protein
MKSLFTYILIFILLISGYCWPAIINIPVDYPTIQQGIDASVNGDTVLVQPATYVENINFNGHNIVLGSLFLTTGDTSYISSTIIDGDSASSVVIFNHQEDSTAVITGFSLTNGLGAGTNPYFGAGGITCWMYSSPKITRNHIYGNSTYGNSHMGGIYSYASSPIISGNKIFDNQETAITCRTIDATVGYPPLIDNNIIFNNSGNGINCWTSSPIITNNTICGNGNGIRCWESNPII